MGLFGFKKSSKENVNADENAYGQQQQNYQCPPQAYYQGSSKLIGYYANWTCYRGYEPTKIPVEKLTHINYAFANIENGEVVLGDKWADIEKPYGGDENCPIKGNYNLLLNPNGPIKRRNPNLKVLISVGGWTWSKNFSDVAADEASREKFAISCATFCNRYGFDGVDIDWEFPIKGGLEGNIHRPEDGDNYVLLLKAIRNHLNNISQMNNKQYLLTIASSAASYNYSCLNLKALSEPLDWINLMNYDYAGSWCKHTCHQANLYMEKPLPDGRVPTHNSVCKSVEDFFNQGVPPNKIVIGVPFYGRGFANVEANPNDYTATGMYAKFSGPLGKHEGGNFNYYEIRSDYFNPTSGYIRYWSDNCCAPYLFNPQTRGLIVYDDSWSIHYKAKYAKEHNLGGVMIWELSGDGNDELLNALVSTLSSS
ncbi:hypothetical protein BCR32DRAFT_296682 [Anaeromyces robustus]|jgi:GH18 family chitinase|uniref:GH18 domain-containing protein n=1 Tax=Anaeromyces robustus TaxID=1754192 RepID=A0A1Y1WQW1_9FUNG|nr:hypothetical protein BCR32DRAFT_296682 [Anaeromyces robustus]|eukprot:ORX75775.1 hypothetical protein BCR32DRAFT_296682 [Anaeromyces robustus]